MRSCLPVILALAACASPAPSPASPIPATATATDASSKSTASALERITSANVGRLERVRGYDKSIANVELLRDGTILVDRVDELELVDRSAKTLARLPVDVPGAWAISAETGLEIAAVRFLPSWRGIVVSKSTGTEERRIPLPKIGALPRILSFTRDRIVLADDVEKTFVFGAGSSDAPLGWSGPIRFRKDGKDGVLVSSARAISLLDGRKSIECRNTDVVSLSDDSGTLIAGRSSAIDIIDIKSDKRTKLAATVVGDTWGRDGKIALAGNGGVGLVDRANPAKAEWKKLPPFKCKGKKTTCDERDVKWQDLRFNAGPEEWPTLFGIAEHSMIVWYPGKRVRVLSPDDHDFESAQIAPDGRHVIEFEQGAARVARVLKLPDPNVDAPTDHWPTIIPTEPDVTRGAFSPDGKLVALWNDRTWKVWSLETGRLAAMNAKQKIHLPNSAPIATTDFDDPIVREMLLDPEGVVRARAEIFTLRSPAKKHTPLELFDVRSESVVWRASVSGRTTVSAIEEGGKRVATSLEGSESGYLVFDVAKNSSEPTPVTTGGPVYDLKFFGSRIMSTTLAGDVEGFKDVVRCASKEPVLDAGAKGARVIVGRAKRCIFDAASGALVTEIGAEGNGELARVSTDTTELYTYASGSLSRWDAVSGKSLPSLKVDLVDPSGRSRRPIAHTNDQIVVAAKDEIVTFDRKSGAEVARTAWRGAFSLAVSSEKLVAVADVHGRGAILDATRTERAQFLCGAFNVPEWAADGRSLYCLKTDPYGKPREAGAVFVVR